MRFYSSPSSGGGGAADGNLYDNDGTLAASRTVDGNSFDLDFSDVSSFTQTLQTRGLFKINPSAKHVLGGENALGHWDDDGMEVRLWRDDVQPLQADDSILATEGAFRVEYRLQRQFEGLPVGVIPSLDTDGLSSVIISGRDETRRAQVGGLLGNNGFIHAGTFCRFTPTQGFQGIACTSSGSDMWSRMRDSTTGFETYIRSNPTQIRLRAGNQVETTNRDSILTVDTAHWTSAPGTGGVVWRRPYTAEYLHLIPSALPQQFDGTLRTVGLQTSSSGTPGSGGQDNSDFGVVIAPSTVPTAGPVGGAAIGDALDFVGGTAPVTNLANADIHVNFTFELAVAATGISSYQVALWDNDNNVAMVGCFRLITFDTTTNIQSVSMYVPWDAAIAAGALGYTQLELRVLRVIGSDDIRLSTDANSIMIRRMN